ncbi:MAG: class I SAM-dependent methyltransferase [Solirubrobacterales bacterium]|nr:class I SAM-dependent methyltransferase [Solirubrobacterales bacterium]
MLPSASDRFLAELPDDALVLDVGGWAAPLNRADWVIDLQPHATRGDMGSFGPGPEHFSAETWVVRDICDREPWPFADDQFDFAVCVTTLEDVRDPMWVCSELSRVARAGYVEVPTVLAELIYNVEGNGQHLGHEHHRWIVDIATQPPSEAGTGGEELVFLHKPHNIHHDWTLRVTPRMRAQMAMEEELQGLFWQGEVRARERVVIYEYPLEELRARVRARFPASPAEQRAKEIRAAAAHQLARARLPVRRAAARAFEAGQALIDRRAS